MAKLAQKPGTYDSFVQKKGEQESGIRELPEGELFFTVHLEDGSHIDTEDQIQAEILSRLVKLGMKKK